MCQDYDVDGMGFIRFDDWFKECLVKNWGCFTIALVETCFVYCVMPF
jgi:hypothetical protein